MRLTARKKRRRAAGRARMHPCADRLTQELLELNQAFNMVLHRITVSFASPPSLIICRCGVITRPIIRAYVWNTIRRGYLAQHCRISCFPSCIPPKLPDGIEFLQSARQGSKPAGITDILPFLLHKLQGIGRMRRSGGFLRTWSCCAGLRGNCRKQIGTQGISSPFCALPCASGLSDP